MTTSAVITGTTTVTTYYLGKCQWCGGPIWRNRKDRKAVACSRKCLVNIQAERFKQRRGFRGLKAGKLWQGGTFTSPHGYVFVHIETLPKEVRPMARAMVNQRPSQNKSTSKDYIQLHRVRMAQHLGRPLKRGEQVHHVDGNKENNDITNLELWVKSHLAGVRANDLKCPHCGRKYDEPTTK